MPMLMIQSRTKIRQQIVGGKVHRRIARETQPGRALIREIRHDAHALNNLSPLWHPLGAPQKLTKELMAEADWPIRHVPRPGHRHFVCIRRESPNFPSVVNLLSVFMHERIHKLCDNRGITLITIRSNFVR
jgi:hypothetical protein